MYTAVVPRKNKPSPVSPKPIDSSVFAGLDSALPEDSQRGILEDATQMLRDGLREGNLEKVRIAKEAVITFKRGLGDSEGEKILFPTEFVAAVALMAEREFCMPSQLEQFKESLSGKTS